MKNEMLNLFLTELERRASILEEFRKKEPELLKILESINESSIVNFEKRPIENYYFEKLDIKETCHLSFSGCVFIDCSFAEIDFTYFSSCQFENCIFKQTADGVENFENCKIVNCDFTSLKFDFEHGFKRLVLPQFVNCRYKSVNLIAQSVDYEFLKQFSGIGHGIISFSYLKKSDDEYVDFSGFSFNYCSFDGFDFSNSIIRFTNWDYYGCSFIDCNLNGCKLIAENCGEAIIYDLEMKGAELEGPFILGNVDLEGADLTNAEIILEEPSSLRRVKLNPKSNLDFLNYAYDLSEVNFEGWSLCEFNFESKVMQNVNFRDADLQEAIFVNCDLTGSDFTGANLDAADFSGAILTMVNFGNASIEGTFFDNIIDDFKATFRDDDYNEVIEFVDDDE
jgi:uncharacterized protein YjbI with pentapeptide repeats